MFHGAYFETDFASMLAWRQWDAPDPGVKNCFAMGRCAAATAASSSVSWARIPRIRGEIYFPAGLPDLNDVDGARVDLARNVMREIGEETGLTPADFEAQPGWITVLAGPRIAQVKTLHARETAAVLRARILAHLAREAQPELADIRIVRGPADFDPMMPPFVTAFLTHVWSQASEEAS